MTITTHKRPVAPTIGDEVATIDGHKLGKVQEVRGDFFRVRRGPFGHGYWLDASLMYESEDGAEELIVAILGSQVNDHKLSESAVQARFEPRQDAILSDDEQRAQRERMERSLRN